MTRTMYQLAGEGVLVKCVGKPVEWGHNSVSSWMETMDCLPHNGREFMDSCWRKLYEDDWTTAICTQVTNLPAKSFP